MDFDRGALARDLRAAIEGEVRFGAGDRAVYSADASNYRQVPVGAVVPATIDDVVATVEVCRRHGVPVLARGGGTSVAGQCVNEAVVVDTTRHLTHILGIDPEDATARVQPGVVLDDLRRAAARHGLTFGPDPATHDRCTLGGMIGNNSCGVHSLTSGRTADQVVSLDVLTYDGTRMTVGQTSDADRARIVAGGGRRGEIYGALADLAERHGGEIRSRFPRIPRRVSGYNLDELLPERDFHLGRVLAGTEGTCVTVLEATVRLVPAPPARSLVVAGFPDVATAADHVPDVLALGPAGPLGLEGFDEGLAGFARRKGLWDRDLALLPEGGAWLFVEMGGGSDAEAQAGAAGVARLLERSGAACARVGEDEARRVWRLRESAAGAASFVPQGPEYWPGWEDSAVAPGRLGPYLRDLQRLFHEHGYTAGLYGHFGEGCVHCRVDFGLRTEQGRHAWLRFLDEAADLVVGYGGSLSGEHGDGQARAFLLPKMFGDELVVAFRAFKSVWDPEGRMNPGKVVDPLPPDANLRLGAGHRPRLPAGPGTWFDHGPGGFVRATERCVGIGACRRTSGGTMCPSYRATLDEQHSTRGRARLLFEMLEGDVVADGWRSVAVREALDLCLACKACRTECPVGVDMATWKAEFLAHHYRGRLRPRVAWSMGLFHRWGRAASLAPSLFNALADSPGVRVLVKGLAGVAPERRIPRFARSTFVRQLARRPPGAAGGRPVVLWPDTFSNRLHPEVLEAAAVVLADAGFAMTVPTASVCCGRPLYDFGMLRAARRQLRAVLRALGPAVRDGVPVVVMEPSCLSVFRDELRSMLPGDPEAARLSGLAVSLAELLVREGYEPPQLTGRALVHGHCHHKALTGMEADTALLAGTGLEADVLDAGCCGMAGAFGFDRRHYDLSVRIGELALLPAVRAAPPGTLVIADGFSCREQILQLTGRRALHTAEVLRMGLQGREA